MRRATGSNTPEAANKVSIQQSLDGHSFSVRGLDCEFTGSEPVAVEVLSARTMLVPKELFDAERARALLAANGMPLRGAERVVWSDTQAETVAVIAVHPEAIRQTEERLGARVRFTTPLLHVPIAACATVWLYYTGLLLYIKVYKGALQLAEVIEAPAEADILFALERLGQEFAADDYELCVAGERDRPLYKLLRKRFPKIRCE